LSSRDLPLLLQLLLLLLMLLLLLLLLPLSSFAVRAKRMECGSSEETSLPLLVLLDRGKTKDEASPLMLQLQRALGSINGGGASSESFAKVLNPLISGRNLPFKRV
jgi:hypothetical protein